ncbi:hypothetical protein EUA76_00330 [TM7 phylum sp. oral taxon 350]|nr:hypothetical protein EUA76_00330 [TM7 phylum sp. oral taxon 350]
MKNKSFSLKASIFSYILGALMAIVIIGAFVGAYYLNGFLIQKKDEVSKVENDVVANESSIGLAQALEQYIKNNRKDIDLVKKVVSDTKEYQYQDDIINDIVTYAAQTGLKLLSVTFPTSASSSSSKDKSAPVKTMQAVIEIDKEFSYDKYINFIYKIEQNISKMKILQISIDLGKEAGSITGSSIKLEVYVK